MLEVKRKQGESIGSMVRRFSGALQKSGILLRAKKHQFFHSKETKRVKKQRALRREELKKQYEKAKKLGKEVSH